jgi:hypothetical protein
MAATSPKAKGASAKVGAARGSSRTLPPLVVRYTSRMKRQRVYPCEVRWGSGKRAAGTTLAPITVRLVMAGAQVVPSERTLDPNRANDRALFYVTPLAKGWLRGERLEVLEDGRKVQEIPLPAKVVSQRATLVLLLLTIFLPWLWQEWIRGPLPTLPGDPVEHFLAANSPHVADFIKSNVPAAAGFLIDLRVDIKDALNWVHYQAWEYPITYYLAAGLLVLTLLSAFLHRTRRKRRVGKPIPLPDEEEEVPPLATRRGQAAAVEPVG